MNMYERLLLVFDTGRETGTQLNARWDKFLAILSEPDEAMIKAMDNTKIHDIPLEAKGEFIRLINVAKFKAAIATIKPEGK